MKPPLKLVIFTGLFVFSASVFAAPMTITLSVPGMTCPVCPITVKKALGKLSGVSAIDVHFDKREAVVTFDDARTNIETLMKATTDAGYPSTVRK